MTMDFHYIYIDGGKRGFLVNMPLDQLYQMLQTTLVQMAIADRYSTQCTAGFGEGQFNGFYLF